MQELKSFRHSRKLSQEKFAHLMGITTSYYQQVERGKVRAGAGFIRKFLTAFPNQSSDLFFKDGGDKNATNAYDK
jgi:transcriptional regulator with XRE-family HTH domain